MNILKLVVFVTFLFSSSISLSGGAQDKVLFDCNKPTNDPVKCLACNVYHEARGESAPGMWMVALVTQNRVEGDLYPSKSGGPKVNALGLKNQFCKVVYEQRLDKIQKKWVPMFSWTRDGKHDRVYNAEKWKLALELSKKIVHQKDEIVDVTFGCQWYHSKRVSPYWKNSYYPSIRIGGHQCYSPDEESYLEEMNSILPTLSSLTVGS